MNVVHVFPYSPRQSGGHSNAIRSFIACQRSQGINAAGIAPRADELPAEPDWGFPLAEVASLWDLRWKTMAEAFGISAGQSLVNFHSINHRFRPLMKDLRRAAVPYVVSEQGQLSFQNAARWLKKFVYLNCVDRQPRKAAGLQVLTRMAYDRLKFLVPAYRGSILLQGNVASFPDPAQMPAAQRSAYGIPSDAFILLFLGRMDIWTKSLDHVVKAFSRLLTHRVRLVLAGPDWQGGQAKLQRLAQRLGCGDRLHFLGPVFGDKKWSLLRMADAFVSPSRREAFSLSVLEAMASGLPVLTSTRINLARQLKAADAALLVPPRARPLAQAMARLEADAQLRAGLIRRAKAWLELHCDSARAGARFCDFYRSILEGRPKNIIT